MRSRRVVLIVRTFPIVSETFVVRRVTELLDRGWDLHIVCDDVDAQAWAQFRELEGRDDVRARVHRRAKLGTRWRVVVAAARVLPATFLAAPSRVLRYLSRGRSSYGVRVLVRAIRDAALIRLAPGIVHYEFGSLAKGNEASAHLVGAKQLVSFQGYDITYTGLGDDAYYEKLWEETDAFHFVSDDLHRTAVRRGLPGGLPAHIVRNGVDDSWLEPSLRDHTEEAGSAERPLRILSVGRLHWKKGFEYALTAVRDLRAAGFHCEYRVIGEGEHREAIVYAIEELQLGDVVTLLGALPSHDVRVQMEWADVFLHPAVSEGFCIAVTEAQAMGLPVIASDAEGLAENVVDGVTGVIVKRRDPAALVRELQRIGGDPGLRASFGKAGRAHVEADFSLAQHVDGIESVYTEIQENRAAG